MIFACVDILTQVEVQSFFFAFIAGVHEIIPKCRKTLFVVFGNFCIFFVSRIGYQFLHLGKFCRTASTSCSVVCITSKFARIPPRDHGVNTVVKCYLFPPPSKKPHADSFDCFYWLFSRRSYNPPLKLGAIVKSCDFGRIFRRAVLIGAAVDEAMHIAGRLDDTGSVMVEQMHTNRQKPTELAAILCHK